VPSNRTNIFRHDAPPSDEPKKRYADDAMPAMVRIVDAIHT
jgi:hypothetical protein